jgi:uncharacterized membrane protein YphA (DoxX/SURF4 family)
MSRIAGWLSLPAVRAVARFGLGATFVYAAVAKIADPPAFAHEVFNYRLLPGAAVNALALWLPWIELVAGIAVLAGVWQKPAIAILSALLVVFVVAISINLARGRAIDCGCFGGKPTLSEAQRFFDMKAVIARDVGLLLLAGIAVRPVRRREPAAVASSPAVQAPGQSR